MCNRCAMRTPLAIAFALCACGKRAEDPKAACASAANRGVTAMVSRATERLATADVPDDARAVMTERTTKLRELAPKLKAVFTNRCVEDKWPRDVIDCYASASAVDEMRACRGKLPPGASTALMKDEMDLMAGTMGPASMAGMPKGPVDPAQVVAANKLAEEMRAVGAQLNETLKQIEAAQTDAERTAAKARLETLNAQAEEIRTKLAAAQALATNPIAPPPPSAQQQAAIEAVQKEIAAVVKEIEEASNEGERAVARAKLEALQEKLKQAKRAP